MSHEQRANRQGVCVKLAREATGEGGWTNHIGADSSTCNSLEK